jgi:hypothetical protein
MEEAKRFHGMIPANLPLFMWGAGIRPEMICHHFQLISEAVDLPIIVFQYPLDQGLGYDTETLVKLTEIPQVAGIKEWSNDIVAFGAYLLCAPFSGHASTHEGGLGHLGSNRGGDRAPTALSHKRYGKRTHPQGTGRSRPLLAMIPSSLRT